MGIIRFTGPDSGTWHPESDPAEPLSAEEEATVQADYAGDSHSTGIVARLLATLDAARQSAPATELELAVDEVLDAFPPQLGGTPRSDALRRLAEARGRK